MRTQNRIILTAVIAVSFSSLFAQVGQSPFSLNGIGDIRTLATANHFGMAEVGIATPTPFNINNMNPAMLVYNRLSSFQMGVALDRRSVATGDTTQTNGGALLNNLVFSFPVALDRWTMSFGLMPLSNVNYDVEVTSLVPGTPIPTTSKFEGEGGLVQAYFSNGIRIAKGLSIGLRGSYIFGSIENESSSFVGRSNVEQDILERGGVLVEADTTISTRYKGILNKRTTYGDVTLGFGVHYRYAKNDDTFFDFGLTFDPATNVDGNSTEWLSRRTLGNRVVVGFDSLEVKTPGSFRLPNRIGVGVAYEKLLNLTIGADVTYQKWSEAREFDGSSDGFSDAVRVALGVEWIPEVNSIDTYFERITYRMGFSYEQSPYLVNNSRVNDFGINFGWSLPVGSGSSFDMGFRFGQRGNLNDNPIRERYFKALVGVTINDRWFVRRRFD